MSTIPVERNMRSLHFICKNAAIGRNAARNRYRSVSNVFYPYLLLYIYKLHRKSIPCVNWIFKKHRNPSNEWSNVSANHFKCSKSHLTTASVLWWLESRLLLHARVLDTWSNNMCTSHLNASRELSFKARRLLLILLHALFAVLKEHLIPHTFWHTHFYCTWISSLYKRQPCFLHTLCENKSMSHF